VVVGGNYLDDGRRGPRQSNLIVLTVALVLAWQPFRDGRAWRVVRLDSVLGIVITGLVFAIVPAPRCT
jgi:hypothetical protein